MSLTAAGALLRARCCAKGVASAPRIFSAVSDGALTASRRSVANHVRPRRLATATVQSPRGSSPLPRPAVSGARPQAVPVPGDSPDRGCAARGARAGRGPGLAPGVTSCFPVPGRGAVGRTPVPEGPAGASRPAVHSQPSGTCGFGGPGLEPGRAARSRSPPSGFLPFFLWGWVLAGFPVFTEVCFTGHLKQSFA